MKRLTYLLMISFSAMAVVACKKEEKLVVSEDQSALSTSGLQPLAAEQTQADIVAEAKKLPLTTLAISENNFNFGDVKKVIM